MNNKRKRAFILFFIALGLSPAFAGTQSEPERASRLEGANNVSQAASSDEFMVVTANAHATQAARDVITQGGNAMDAAIAAALVLNVVEPQSSGLGGSAFLLYFDAQQNKSYGYDGREEAPASAHLSMFLQEDGTALSFGEASATGRAVGIPGFLALLEIAHRKHGALAWRRLVTPAIRLAQEGFLMSPRLFDLAQQEQWQEQRNAPTFFLKEDKTPHNIGARIRNVPLAQSLEVIADTGSREFYHGTIRDEIIKAVRTTPRRPAILTKKDFAEYHVREVTPLCAEYRLYQFCSLPLPTSGGITLIQILSMLSHVPLSLHEAGDAMTIHWMSEASRLAYEDRAFWLADDEFIDVPVSHLLSPQYLEARAQLISSDRVMDATHPAPAHLAKAHKKKLCDRKENIPTERPSTTHISIIDKEGNAVALTASIGPAFGSKIMAAGFFLNGELTDFRMRRHDPQGCRMVNHIEAGKRPLSSMTPLMMFNQAGEPVMVAGSAGGIFIIAYLARVIIAVIEQGVMPFDALAMPHHVRLHRGALYLEKDREIPQQVLTSLSARGTQIERRDMTSGMHVIYVDENGIMHGAADPRREGMALGK